MGSVVPPLTGTMRAMAQRYFGVTALIVEPARNTGMPILYENPAEVGADRIVNAIAAYEQYGRGCGSPADRRRLRHGDHARCGHAPKASTSAARFVPGVQISADALFQRAARLPRIDVRKPSRVVGRTTVGAMESGLFCGYVGMVEGLVRRMSDELGGDAHVRRHRRPRGGDRAGDDADSARGCRSDAAGLENRVGTEPVDVGDGDRRQRITAARSRPTCVGRTTGT